MCVCACVRVLACVRICVPVCMHMRHLCRMWRRSRDMEAYLTLSRLHSKLLSSFCSFPQSLALKEIAFIVPLVAYYSDRV